MTAHPIFAVPQTHFTAARAALMQRALGSSASGQDTEARAVHADLEPAADGALIVPHALIEEWVGHSLTSDELHRLAACLGSSTFPDTVSTIVSDSMGIDGDARRVADARQAVRHAVALVEFAREWMLDVDPDDPRWYETFRAFAAAVVNAVCATGAPGTERFDPTEDVPLFLAAVFGGTLAEWDARNEAAGDLARKEAAA